MANDLFGCRRTLETQKGKAVVYHLPALEEQGVIKLTSMPFSIRILVENLLRNLDGKRVREEDIRRLGESRTGEIAFFPSRILLQDFTGVPVLVDFAGMRSAVARHGGDPSRVNPMLPVDLVIDHSVQADEFGNGQAIEVNIKKEYERNHERYLFIKWAEKTLKNFRVVPPGRGIIHQINLECFSTVVSTREEDGELRVFPETVLGTDSHTTMINALGVLGWGVGGIEAEAVMLGEPYYLPVPEVVGVRLAGELKEGVVATDLALTVAEVLRKKGVVGKFVEFCGEGVESLSLADRATVANMAPEYGATVAFFPTDGETLSYLKETGREDYAELVEVYTKEQGLFREAVEPEFSEVVELELCEVEPSVAGPNQPQDRRPLRELKDLVRNGERATEVNIAGEKVLLRDGAVVIAGIISCTNTSNPTAMLSAGLLAKNAVEKGLRRKPYVKTTLSPGSRIVTDYLRSAGLMSYLEDMGFYVVGYGCMTCIGNSGPLVEGVEEGIQEAGLAVASVVSGNRNFEARIHPLVKYNYLASPAVVVVMAIAGRIDIDLESEPLGHDQKGEPVFIKDIMPTREEVERVLSEVLRSNLYQHKCRDIFEGDELWKRLDVSGEELYAWDATSTYIQEPPFFGDVVDGVDDILGARVLLFLGDSVTTDHISPAGTIPEDSPAGRYLLSLGVKRNEFNTFGSRRGNHEVMVRGTFGNVRLVNKLCPGKPGGWTRHLPDGELMSVYEASQRYGEEGIPLIVIAGKGYGAGSSRDWAAKGTYLLGIRAVIAESFERIHRSNLVGMGVLPLEFTDGQSAESLGLTGEESFEIRGIRGELEPGASLTVNVLAEDRGERSFKVRVRLDSPAEVEHYRNGGILRSVFKKLCTRTEGN